jgi:hypothetical protein
MTIERVKSIEGIERERERERGKERERVEVKDGTLSYKSL